jgi:hypothetical protein
VGPLELKGKSEPLPVFRLLAARPASERRHETVFVGRERELALLCEAWARALGEQGCELVTIVADAGLGKSRLVAEALSLIEARVVRGRCLPYGVGITYWPVVEVLKQLDALPSDPAAVAAIRSLLGASEAATSAEEIAWAFRKLLEEQRRSSLSSMTSSGVKRRSSTWSSISPCSPAAPRSCSSASPARSCSRAAPPGR